MDDDKRYTYKKPLTVEEREGLKQQLRGIRNECVKLGEKLIEVKQKVAKWK